MLKAVTLLTLRHIEIFAMVCREGSITKAAQILHISQPTVSVAIKEMEDHYGNALFERISHKLYLTPFGERIYGYAINVLNLYSDMADAHPKYDVIRVGTGTAIGKLLMPHIVKRFTNDNPGIRISVNVADATRMYRMLMQNSLDLVIAETVDEISGLSYRAIQHYPVVAVCHRDNPLAKKGYVTAADLAKQNLLLRERGSSTRKHTDLFFHRNNLDVNPMWESSSVQTLLNATLENLGVSFHSLDHVVTCITPDIVILNVQDFKGEKYVNVSYPKDKLLTPAMRSFLDFYQEETERMLAEGVERYNSIHDVKYPFDE